MQTLPILTKSQQIFIKSLHSSNTKKHNYILVEGIKCCKELINSNCKIEYLVINSDNKNVEIDLIISEEIKKGLKIFQVKNSIFKTLCDAKTPQSIIAVATPKINNIINNQTFIMLDNVTDPGNVGTIIRTADWFGIKQIILFGNCVNKYSPKVIRSSMGSIFRINIINCNDIEILKKHFSNIPIYAASLKGNIDINCINKNNLFGLIVGNESRGISTELTDIITQSFYINGYGNAESLNVAIATGITLFHFTK